MAHNNLGAVFVERILGERAENIEQAIRHYEWALEVCTQEVTPDHWAMIREDLGIAYSNQILGEQAENLEEAIQHYKLALEVYTREGTRWTGQCLSATLGMLMQIEYEDSEPRT